MLSDKERKLTSTVNSRHLATAEVQMEPWHNGGGASTGIPHAAMKSPPRRKSFRITVLNSHGFLTKDWDQRIQYAGIVYCSGCRK